MQRLAEGQHIGLAGVIDRHAGAGQEGGDRRHVENAAAMPGEAVDKGKRQFGERADVEVDHGELLGMAEISGRAGQSEAGIVDHDRGLEAARRKLRRNARDRIALLEIDRQHRRPRPAGGRDFIGER